jgi:hypothetical protein
VETPLTYFRQSIFYDDKWSFITLMPGLQTQDPVDASQTPLEQGGRHALDGATVVDVVVDVDALVDAGANQIDWCRSYKNVSSSSVTVKIKQQRLFLTSVSIG